MNRRFRRFNLGAALASAALVLATAGSVSGETVTLKVTYAPNNLAKVYDAIAERFQQEYKDIRIELSAQRNYEELAQATLRGSLVGDLPDVSHQGTKLVPFLVKNKITLPLNAFIESEPDWENKGYVSSINERCADGGKINCIPFSLSPYIVYYNADLVRRAGGDPDNFPSDWAGMLELAEKISALDERIMGVYHDFRGDLAFQTQVFSRGGRMMTEDETKVAFGGDEGLWGLDLMKRAAAAGMRDIGRNQAFQAFAAGQVGIVTSAASRLGKFEKQSKGVFELRTATYPMATGATEQPAGGNVVVMTATDQAKRRAAWEYIKFATGPVGQTIMVKRSGYVPVNTIAVETPELLGDMYAQNPNLHTAVSRLPMIRPMYAFKSEHGIKVIKEIEKTLGSVVRGEQTPEEARNSLVKQARMWLER